MPTHTLYYVTNRKHEGADRWHPKAYGKKFSDDGMENLRFGVVTVTVDDAKVQKHLRSDLGDCGVGNGEKLASYLSKCAETAAIEAYPEKIDPKISEAAQKSIKLGSAAMFSDLKTEMESNSDVLIYIHGFNVGWHGAVGAALSLQIMLRNAPDRDPNKNVTVVLFTWPSDGMALPWVSYKSDRSEAAGSGAAVGRGFLKARDFLASLRDRGKGGAAPCGQDIHLLCHSMGNYLLQHALVRLEQFTPGAALPRLFEQVFLCAPDVDDTALESGHPLGQVHEIARQVSLYHNRGDVAMVVSDYTKGNPDRLGGTGASHPALLHNKVHQVDCTPIVHGLVEHSYYLAGKVAGDIRASIDRWTPEDGRRRRIRRGGASNVWAMTK